MDVRRRGRRMTLTLVTRELTEENNPSEPVQAVEETPGLGLTLQTVTPAVAADYGLPRNRGVLVVQVAPGDAAAEAGLQPGDIIVEVEQAPVAAVEDFRAGLRRRAELHTILLLVDREGNTIFMTMTISPPSS